MRMRSVRLASMAAIGIATVGGSWTVATSAAALEIGPVSVPATLPTVGPVVVQAPVVAPELGVTATVSPATGVVDRRHDSVGARTDRRCLRARRVRFRSRSVRIL